MERLDGWQLPWTGRVGRDPETTGQPGEGDLAGGIRLTGRQKQCESILPLNTLPGVGRARGESVMRND